VPTRPRMLHDRRLPHHSGASLISPVLHPAREVMLTRHHQGFPVSRPVPSLPLACDPRPERGPLGFSMSSAPGRYRPRTSWRGQVTDTNPKSRHRHQPASMSDGLTPHVRPHVAGITHTSLLFEYPSPGPLRPAGGVTALLGRSLLLVGWAARRGPGEPGPFPGSLPPNPVCTVSMRRALQRFMPRARPGSRGSSHGTARR
jgi:hypothetical protein